jgi:hypothetical protein
MAFANRGMVALKLMAVSFWFALSLGFPPPIAAQDASTKQKTLLQTTIGVIPEGICRDAYNDCCLSVPAHLCGFGCVDSACVTLPHSGACKADSECSLGPCIKGSCYDNSGGPCGGTFKPDGVPRWPLNNPADQCGRDQYCDNSAGGRCRPALREGESCPPRGVRPGRIAQPDFNGCASGLTCSRGRCVKPGIGTECRTGIGDRDNYCGEGLVCVSGRCANPAGDEVTPAGKLCLGTPPGRGLCANGRICIPGVDPCAPGKLPGDLCDGNFDCASYFCDSETRRCRDRPVPAPSSSAEW